MKKGLLAIPVMVGALVISCSSPKENVADATAAPDTAKPVSLVGKWNIENIVINDNEYVRPSEATPDIDEYIVFTDSTYSVNTNCNTLAGGYKLDGNNISWTAGLSTMMACENMAVEDMFKQVINDLDLVDALNDSTVRLNSSNTTKYIVLTKAAD